MEAGARHHQPVEQAAWASYDQMLRSHHRHQYEHVGRWVLAVSVLVGAGAGAIALAGAPFIGALTGIIAGGVILNTLKEELPDERNARFVPFAVGALAYGGLLLIA